MPLRSRFGACIAALMLAALALGFTTALGVRASLALTFPALSGRVVDEAGILDLQTEAPLAQKLAALEAETRTQLVVVTNPSRAPRSRTMAISLAGIGALARRARTTACC